MPSTVRKGALLLLKLLVSGWLLSFLFSRIGSEAILASVRRIDPITFFIAVLLYLAATYISALRWQLLIPCSIRTRVLFGLYMIGTFFNTYLPGLVGGDAVKAWYLTVLLRQQGFDGKAANGAPGVSFGPLTAGVASVFMDRYIGLGALLFLGMICYPFGIGYFEKTAFVWLLPALFTGYAVISAMLFFLPAVGAIKVLAKFSSYASHYRTNVPVLMKTFAYSLCTQLLGFTAVYILAKGLGLDISFLSVALYLPIIIITTMLPVSISGIGVREYAFIYFFGAAGVSPQASMTLSLLWFFSVVIAGLWGLVEYLRVRQVFGAEKEEKPL
ncbi:MAG TPA: lysylphosphatidylglycerol synthase transmembrane domain-containing protein [Dissulfurispiraceae bacterium]|nr:lysylphosphatidylglycerol synthase transmembrane domain-containing protein [Dissulfurispiraceae bacterium]